MSAKAVLRSGKRNVKPYSRKRLGIERRPVKARLGSVLKMKAPIFTAHDGVGGAQGRCNAERKASMNSRFVSGDGPVAFKTPEISDFSIAPRNISLRSSM